VNDQDKKLRIRYLIMACVILLGFAYLASGLVRLQLEDSDVYAEDAESGKTLTIKLRGKRGNIIDADSVILAEDQLIYNVTFYKDRDPAVYQRALANLVARTKRDEMYGQWNDYGRLLGGE
jgi:cell division protein FtsI/penicillin-binding protein 2